MPANARGNLTTLDAPKPCAFDRINWLEKRNYIDRRSVWAASLLGSADANIPQDARQ